MLEKTGQNKQWTIDYLLGVYARSKRHQQSIQSMKNRPGSKEVVEEMEAVCALAQQLAISNVVTQLNYDIFPQALPTSLPSSVPYSLLWLQEIIAVKVSYLLIWSLLIITLLSRALRFS